jgi:hypothetical protein
MLRDLVCLVTLAGVLALGAACSSTTVTGSWRNPDFTGSIRTVYVVGIAKQETHRRIFEDEFSRKLQTLGITGIPSYRDLAEPQQASKEAIDERVRQQGADSVLVTRIIGKRTEEVVMPGRITSYGSGPYYGQPYRYTPDPYYRHWGSYYDRSFDTIYEPPTVTKVQVVTIEANLYEAKSGELIWSAQLDTVLKGNTQRQITDFIEAVTRDLRSQGVL